jgi:hypothetical protein
MKNKITYFKLLFALVFTGISVTTFSQPVFQKTYTSSSPNEKGEFAGPANGGGIIICGKTVSMPYDAILMKTDNSGVLQWSYKLTGPGDDVLNCIRPTSDGGYISVGYTTSSGAGGKDVLLVKLTSTGTVSWSKTFGSPTDDIGYDVQQTTDGGYIITGSAKDAGSSSVGAIYLVKTDNTGIVTWSNMWGAGIGNEGKTVIQTADGGYFVGANSSTGYFFLIKTTSTGSVTWSRANRANAMSSVALFQAIQTSDGGFALIGNAVRMSDNNIDIAFVKTNSTGVVQYWKTYGGTSIDFGMGIQEVTGGNFLAVGYTSSFGTFSDVILLRIGSTGTLTSSKTTSYVGSTYDGTMLSKTSDGLYTYASMRNDGVYLLKTDATGITGCTSTTAAATDNTFTAFYDNAIPLTGTSTTTTNSPTYSSTALTLVSATLCSAVVGIEEESLNKFISIYPNPASDNLDITIDNQLANGEIGVKIYDLFGKLIYTKNTFTNSDTKIDVREIPSGMYLLNFFSKDASFSKRIVIQH